MNDRLIERTNGRHRLAIFPARQLGEEEATIEQTRAGAIDIDRISIGPLAAFVPELRVLSLPFLFKSSEHFHKVLDGEIGEEILASFDAHGFVGLTYYDSGARSLYSRLRPVRTLADLKALKIRIQQSEIAADFVRALGAEPVVLAYGQVLTGLSTGLIDGAENNWPSYVTTEHYRAAPYYSLTQHTMLPEVLIMTDASSGVLDITVRWEDLDLASLVRDVAESNRTLAARKGQNMVDSSCARRSKSRLTPTIFERLPR